jgi:hypothetical protein
MSGTKRFTQVDSSTGEAVDGFVAVIKPKVKSSFERHFTMNQAALLSIAQTLNHDQTRVLLALFAYLDYENFIQVPQIEIAEQLNMHKQHVNRAVKALIANEIILDGPKIGRSKSYRLNPNYGWKGSVSNHKKVLKHGFSVIDGGKS